MTVCYGSDASQVAGATATPPATPLALARGGASVAVRTASNETHTH